MKNFTLTILFLSLLSITSWGQCTASFTSSTTNNGSITIVNTSTHGAYFDCDSLPQLTSNFLPSGASVSFNAYNSGDYYICAYVVDSTQTPICTDQYCDSVNVNIIPCTTPVDASFFSQLITTSPSTTYHFSIIDSSNVANYSWDFGNGSTGSTPESTVIYNQPGTYTICLSITDSLGVCQDASCQTIVVTCNVNSNYNIAPSTVGGQPLTYELSAVDTSNIISYSWDFGDGNISTSTNPIHTYTQPGSYTICLITTSVSGCIDTTCNNYSIVCNNNSNFNVAVSPITQPLTYDFTVLDTSNIASYSWSFGDGNSSNSSNPIHTYSIPGTYNVCLIATSIYGCIDTTCINIPVNNNPCSVTANFTSLDSNGVVSIVNTGSDAYFDIPALGLFTPIFIPAGTSTNLNLQITGTYLVCAYASDSSSTPICSDQYCDSIDFTANSTPCNINSSFTQTVSSISNNDSLSYIFNLIDTNGICLIEWDFGDGSTGQGDFYTHTYSQGGFHTVRAVVHSCGPCLPDTTYHSINIGNLINPCNILANYNWFQVYDSLNGNFQNMIYLVDYTTAPAAIPTLYYSWDFGDGTTSNLTYPSHTYASVGTYTVCLTVTNGNGCNSTYCDSIYIQTKASGFSLNVISQNAVGIEETQTTQFGEIYPNPTSENSFMTINSINNSEVTIRIIDISGKIISQKINTLISGENTIQLDTQNLTNGMYFISITDEKGTNTNLRLIKK